MRLQHVVGSLSSLLALPPLGFKLALPACLELLSHESTWIDALRLLEPLTAKLGMEDAVSIVGPHIERLLSKHDNEALHVAVLDTGTITVILRRLGTVCDVPII